MLYPLFWRLIAYACALALVAAAAPSLGKPALWALDDKTALLGLCDTLLTTKPHLVRRSVAPLQAALSRR